MQLFVGLSREWQQRKGYDVTITSGYYHAKSNL